MEITTVALGLSTGFALLALAVATAALRTAQRLSRWQEWPYQKIEQLEARSDDHDVQLTQHHERLRKVNARLAARDRRQRPAEEDPEDQSREVPASDIVRKPGESEFEWKKRVRVLIAQGKVGHGR